MNNKIKKLQNIINDNLCSVSNSAFMKKKK